MTDDFNKGGAGADEVSDADLLTIIRQPGAYSVEVLDAARLEAQLRGLAGRFEDAEYKVVLPEGGEPVRVDVVGLKRMYCGGVV